MEDGPFSFNLLDAPWIPCLLRPPGGAGAPESRELGIAEVLSYAADIIDVVGDTPLERVVIVRVLLAILHRRFGPATAREWSALWNDGRFPKAELDDYFDRWRRRFDLFDSRCPFYQTAGLDVAKAGSVARLQYQADNNATLFDHSVTSRPPEVTAAKAARLALTIQSFDTCGTKTGDVGQAFAESGPLVQAAVAMFRGSSLFHTLLLNLHRYSPDRDGEPWQFHADEDLPAWERTAPSRPENRYPAGYCDLLTWQSRRLWLEPKAGRDGDVVVQRAVVMNGNEIPKDFDRRGRETMVSFRRRRDTTGTAPPWSAVRFQEDRAAWRDSYALFTSLSPEAQGFKMARWVSDLVADGALPDGAPLPVDLAGLTTDRAKCMFWRQDRMSVPAKVLMEPVVLEELQRALELAERVAELVSRSWVTVADESGAATRRRSALAELAMKLVDGEKAVAEVVTQLGAGRQYWTALAGPFHRFLTHVVEGLTTDQFGNRVCDPRHLLEWRRAVHEAATGAFIAITRAVGTRGRALEAVAVGERAFRALLRMMVGDLQPVITEEEQRHAGNIVG